MVEDKAASDDDPAEEQPEQQLNQDDAQDADDEPEPEPQPDAEEQSDAEEQAEDEPEPEPEPELSEREMLEQARAEMKEIKAQLANLPRIVGGEAGRAVDRLLPERLKQLTATMEKADKVEQSPTATPRQKIQEKLAAVEEFNAMKEDFPEIANLLEKALGLVLPDENEQQPPGMTQDQLNAWYQETRLEEVHPGWKDQVASPEFGQWFNGQLAALEAKPEERQKLISLAQSPHARDAIELLDMFKRPPATSQPRKSNNRQARAASRPATTSGGVLGRSSEQEIFQRAFSERRGGT